MVTPIDRALNPFNPEMELEQPEVDNTWKGAPGDAGAKSSKGP